MIRPVVTKDTHAPTNAERLAAFRHAAAFVESLQLPRHWDWPKQSDQEQEAHA